MRKAMLLTVVLMLCASLAFAQGGSVGIFADPGGTNCNIADAGAGLLAMYVVHVLHTGATASQFSAPMPACMIGATYLSDGQVYPVTIGNSQTGVSVGYGVCEPAPTHVLTVQFFGAGLTSLCCRYKVLADPGAPSGQIEVVDCVEALVFATGGTGIINPDATCQCDVPTQDTTWGQVKSLFQ